MSATNANFKIADVSRAIKGAVKGGMIVGRAEIDPATGKIALYAADAAPEPSNAYDGWKQKKNARST